MKRKTLKEKYEKEIRSKLMREFKLKSLEAAPKLTKIVVNMGTADLLKNKDTKEKLMLELAAIAGQKPTVRSARISVAGFGIREGNPVGLSVTLRRARMYSFFERLVSIVLPRLRDFRGVSLRSFDKNGNYTIGFKEYSVFPEVGLSKLDRAQGLEVTIVTDTKEVEKAKRLLELMGMPFEKEEGKEK